MNDTLLWALSAGLVLLGFAGIVLPALPGTLLVWAGLLLAAWIDDFQRIGGWPMAAITVMALIAWALDYVAGLMGARHLGASKQALIGAALGTVVGLFMGLVGVFFMPLVGAAVGEYLARRDHPDAAPQALKVGVGTWVGMLVGMLAKFVLAFVMIGVAVAAYLW
ncbi:MAG: DUF456 domain-containing protein [Ideonella sp. MAG2]|nr:MAG: DUF456 domain-containing protein [Ideonella sp. MAG2]